MHKRTLFQTFLKAYVKTKDKSPFSRLTDGKLYFQAASFWEMGTYF